MPLQIKRGARQIDEAVFVRLLLVDERIRSSCAMVCVVKAALGLAMVRGPGMFCDGIYGS